MSSALTANPSTPTAPACGPGAYDIPTKDAACAISGAGSNSSDILKACCKDAPQEKFANDCSVYCLASGQSAGDLNSCFQKQGANPAYVFCNANNTATATGKVSASGKATGGASGTAGGAQATGSKAAAPGMDAPQVVSKKGLGVLAMLFVSAAAGTLL